MHPYLFRVGRVAIGAYGTMLAFAFVVGVFFARRQARRAGISASKMTHMLIWAIISGLMGARGLYVLLNWESGDLLSMVNPMDPAGFGRGGLIFYGGLLAGLAVGFGYMRIYHMPVWKTADAFAPSIALGIFLVRIGCFLSGCCFGKPSEMAWAISFPEHSPAGYVFPHTPLHPTQLYASLYGLTIFVLLLFLERFRRFDGFTFWLFIMLYSMARFLVDFVRYYETSMVMFELKGISLVFNQGISVLLFVVAGATLLVLRRQAALK